MNNTVKKKIFNIAIIFVVLVSILFRFYQFPAIPPSLNWDEAAYGYNAYSILKTGKDEFGKFMPLYFRSLDDYKLPVQMYFISGAIALFGYNDFSVRFPSAFFGTLTILVIIFLTFQLFKNRWIALFAGGTLAILPWHIQFSRMAAEANIGLFFLTLGITLFNYGIKKKYWLTSVAVICLGLSAYSYLSFKIVAPLIGLTLVAIFWKELNQITKKHLIGFFLITALVGLVFISDLLINKVHLRFKGTNVFQTKEVYDIFQHKQQEMFVDAKQKINIPRRLFHDNAIFTTADIVTRAYIMHFSPTFLFFDYDQKQHHTPFVGLCYIWMLLLIPIGFYFLLRRMDRKGAILIILWILIAPIPASVTWDIPHAIRVYGMSIPLVIITGIGMYYLLDLFNKKRLLLAIVISTLSGFILLSSYYYLHQYTIHLPIERSKDWVYGRKELTSYLEANKQKYDRIIISSSLEWPYIFLLYYSQYDPQKYLDQGGTVSGGFAEEGNKYDIFEFHKFRSEDLHKTRTLFVGKPDEFMSNIVPLHTIYYLDGAPAIYIAEGDGKI
jgi:4-amino-4-deoxy-L-arabinose transferase-like glycosyltransferase